MSKQSGNNSFVDEWALFIKAVAFLALLTGFLYLRVMLGQGAPLAAGSNAFTSGLVRVLVTVVAIGGLLAGWYRPLAGGTVAAFAGLLLGWQVYDTAVHDPLLLALAYGSPFVITGALYIVYGWSRQHPQ